VGCDRRCGERGGREAVWAASRGLAYFETSAKDGNTVTLMFEALFAAALAAVEQKAGKRARAQGAPGSVPTRRLVEVAVQLLSL